MSCSSISPVASAVSHATIGSLVSGPQLVEYLRERCENEFPFFVRYFFFVRKGTRFVFNSHHHVICRDLQGVYEGKYEGYVCNVPPRYGKTELIVVMFILWCFVKNRRCEFIHLSYSLPLALENSDAIRSIMKSSEFQQLWPDFRARDGKDATKSWATTEGGVFYASQAGGGITGFGAGRLDEWNEHTKVFRFSGAIVIDDPVKPDDAQYERKRKNINGRWHSTIKSRRNSPRTPVICVMQRIDHDDFTAELLSDTDIKWHHRVIPALLDEGKKTERALWEAKHSLASLKKLAMTNRYIFDSQYQQVPTPRGGQFFTELEKLQIVQAVPRMTRIIRYWDKAGTEGGGAYTAGVRMGLGVDGLYYFLDVVRGQWRSARREAVIEQTAALDGLETEIWIEQEPGSGGKESAENTIRRLAGYSVYAERPSGDKAVRAEPLSVQISAGNVRMLQGAWNAEFLNEMRVFPGKYKDQVDASSGAFNKLAIPTPVGLLLKRAS